MKRKDSRTSKMGFTMVELSLSIAFIAVLSLAVVLIITNSISAYHRGIVLSQLNTVGMELVDDIRATIQNGSVIAVENMCETAYRYTSESDSQAQTLVNECKKNGGQNLVAAREKSSNMKIGNEQLRDVPVYGVLCVGNYSYLWNSGYLFSDDVSNKVNKIEFKYRDAENGFSVETASNFRLLKIKDDERMVCSAYDKKGNSNTIDVSSNDYAIIPEKPIDLLSKEDTTGGLALYDLYAPVPAINASRNNLYYSISFVLGTLSGGANVTRSGNFCATPEGLDNAEIENFDYCAINKFNFAAQASGGQR